MTFYSFYANIKRLGNRKTSTLMRGRPTAHHKLKDKAFANTATPSNAYPGIHHRRHSRRWNGGCGKHHHHTSYGGDNVRKGIKRARLVWGAIGAVLLGAFALIPLGAAFPLFH